MRGARFWLAHALLPLALFGVAAWLVAAMQIDLRVGDWMFDAVSGRFPARGQFWADDLMHDGGRLLVQATGFGAVLLWLGSFLSARARAVRRGAGYVALCFALGPGLVALGKQLSAVDCPTALERYGGARPYVAPLAVRPQGLAPGHCFPAGHSSGAFAFFAFYFLRRETRPKAARAALGGALALGLAFAATQWARGAHFPSHDLVTAFICWNACLALYALVLRPVAASRAQQAHDTAPASPA